MIVSKKVCIHVILCCSVFLTLVYGASLWMKHSFTEPKKSIAAIANKEEQKVVYLTFDDGPSKNTQAVLDILQSYHVKATFFVTGENSSFEDMIAKEYKEGNGIGIHTFSHNYGEIYASKEAYIEDMNKMNTIIEKQIGHRVNIMRFPGGSSNTISRKYKNGIMKTLSQVLIAKGYQYYDWNASNGDGNCYKTKQELIDTAKKEVGKQNSVMMLLHDGTGNKATVEALPSIIETLQKEGYKFKTIQTDTDTPVFHHHIAN